MEQLQEEAAADPRRHVQLAAIRFYLHFVLWECKRFWYDEARGITNYKTLLDRIEFRRSKYHTQEAPFGSYQAVCLVTFNYDTILEDALAETLGIVIREIPDYVASESYKLIKVHGSVNWAREVLTTIPDLANQNTWQVGAEFIRRAAELNIANVYRVVTQHPIGKLEDPPRAAFPAVAIPVETKRAFECPESHLEALRHCIPEVRKLLIIGWRGTELHFVNLFRELCRGQIAGMIVARDEKEAEEAAVRLQHLPVTWSVAKVGFTEFVTSPELDVFLRD